MTRRQFVFLGTAAGFAALGLAGCGGSGSSGNGSGKYKDGSYTGQSSTLDAGVDGDGYGIITITVEGGKITDAQFQAFQVDGTAKDKSYGKDGAYYGVAQKAVSAGEDYTKAFLESGSVDGVDVITGATFLHDQFVEAAEDALSQASGK